jgi:Trk-type K+ transport system membrane component
VVGSSAISSAGFSSITEASMMRWRMPPENWCG